MQDPLPFSLAARIFNDSLTTRVIRARARARYVYLHAGRDYGGPRQLDAARADFLLSARARVDASRAVCRACMQMLLVPAHARAVLVTTPVMQRSDYAVGRFYYPGLHVRTRPREESGAGKSLDTGSARALEGETARGVSLGYVIYT